MELVNTISRKVIQVLIILITFMLIYSLVEFIFLLGRAALTQHAAFNFEPGAVDRSKLFFSQVQGLVSAVLLLTILIELIASLVEYLKVGSKNYVTVITEIALIAIVRHLLSIDFEHVQAEVLYGLSALIFVVGLFYLLTTKHISLINELTTKNRNSDETKHE